MLGLKHKKVLHLNLYRKYFDQIRSGIKRYEYRSMTPYWTKRLKGKDYDYILFRNGYGKHRPYMVVAYKGLGKGYFNGLQVWAIKLGKIVEQKP
jgi:hypothetical protein